ncbi:uncharacterized protein LOC117104354 [Anneissia japonica]|uniref:uncharacterized protein LOC117104354 n=1 Tax=Anneissia japonica TaxID=1529436 RepID=UPI0014256340|nr:uncharacterized protein LOC117104354 [Anneissia japonica]
MGVNDCVGGDISMNFDSIGPHKELNADDIKAGKKILNGLRYSSMVKQPHNGHRDFRETELGTVFTFQQSDYTNSLPVNLSGDIPCLVNGKMDKGIKSIGGVEDVEERRSRPRLRNLKLDIPNPVVPSFDVNKEHISGDSISRVSDTIAKFDTTPSPKHFIPIVNKRRSRSLSPCVPSPASLKSPTIRPVSPRIQHLCSRFSGEENILPECQKLMDYTEKIDQHSSSDISSVTRDMGMPHSFISNEQKSSSEVSENQNSWALPVGQSNTSTSNNVNLRNCLSPCISPSSGYGSGRYSSSPVNLSPRCHSPVAHSTECHDGLSQSMHTKASRTHSVDSGHHSTNLDTSDFQLPEMFDRNIKSPISQNFMDSSSRRSKLLSRSSHVFDSTELDVPEPLIYRPSSPVDEGFEEGNKSVKTSSVNSSNKIKRTQLTVRLKNIGPASPDLLGSSLKTMALSPKPRLCETSNNTVWSSASFSSMEMLPSPPAVIVTDDYGVSQDKGIFPSNSSVDQNSVGVAIDVPQIDILPADDLKSPKKSLLNRKLSNTSTCSSFSLDESEQEDNNEDCQIPTTGQKKRVSCFN